METRRARRCDAGPPARAPAGLGLRTAGPAAARERGGGRRARGAAGPAEGRVCGAFGPFPRAGRRLESGPAGPRRAAPRSPGPPLGSAARADAPECAGAGSAGVRGLLADARRRLQTVSAGPRGARLLRARGGLQAAVSARLSPPALGFPAFSI